MIKSLVKPLSMITIILIMITLIPTNSFATNKYTLDDFVKEIEDSDIYREYQDDIEIVLNQREADGEDIHRKTVQYKLKSEGDIEKTLVFVSNENLEYEFIGIIEISDTHIKSNNLLNNTSETIGIQMHCQTFYCTKTKIVVDPVKIFNCSYVLGEVCNNAFLLSPVKWLLCQGGVIVGCTAYAANRICIEGDWLPVCAY